MIREAANSGPRRDLLGADLQRLFGALFVVQSFTAGSNRSFCRFQTANPGSPLVRGVQAPIRLYVRSTPGPVALKHTSDSRAAIVDHSFEPDAEPGIEVEPACTQARAASCNGRGVQAGEHQLGLPSG